MEEELKESEIKKLLSLGSPDQNLNRSEDVRAFA